MQKFQDSVFSVVKTSELSPSVFSFLQPTDDLADQTPLGGVLKDTNFGWLALGPKLCVINVKTGLKVASWTFGTPNSSSQTSIVTVVEIPTPLTTQSRQLVVSLSCNGTGQICVFHINGSHILRCIETDHVLLHVTVCENALEGPLSCFDGVILGGTKSGEVVAFDLNRSSLIQALSDLTQGNDGQVRNENNMTGIILLHSASILQIDDQRELAIDNDYHLAILLNDNSIYDGQFIFYNPDGSIRMKALQAHVRVTSVQYIPQLASVAVGFNFGAFQIWNLMTLELEYSSQVNVECLPVTHFGFQEPCDDPRAFCYLWVVYSVIDRFDNEGYPFAVMYSLNYQGKRMLANNKCLYQDFLTSSVRFQVELSSLNPAESDWLVGGRCISCHTYSIDSTLGEEGEDSLLNLCQLVWECWGEDSNTSTQYGHLLFDLDQWYKDQMPATYQLQSNTFMSVTACMEASRDELCVLDVRVMTSSVTSYSHATRLEEHFYPNSLQYKCVCLSTSECRWVSSSGVQRALLSRISVLGPGWLANPTLLYEECVARGLTPLYHPHYYHVSLEDKRRYLLSVALEARLVSFLRKCAHDWATGAYENSGCTLAFMVDWCWQRAIELKQNAKELTSPLFTSSSMPDRNLVRCLEHCVRQLNELSGLLDSILTKCCNLIVPEMANEISEKLKSVGLVSLYFGMVKWWVGVGLLPDSHEPHNPIPYPHTALHDYYQKRRIKLSRLQDSNSQDETAITKSSPLLYIDQLIEHECGGELVHNIWRKGGSATGLYPPPSLYSLLRIYLIPEIAEEHKHSLILYLLVDYTNIYDDSRYEEVIRRLMQFPTMFGLSNTAIKATQAFWYLDHRHFDFALDQLQCLTGNTLSDWQHHVVLSSLLAQKKTQAALQYLHVRKPAPLQAKEVAIETRLSDWQSSCKLYLARGLVYQALDVVRMCVNNINQQDQWTVMSYFFKELHHTGQLSKLLQLTLTPFEEESFIKYLTQCNEPAASDILIMFYLQQARYIEAQQYAASLAPAPRIRRGTEDTEGWEGSRDAVVGAVCGGLPRISEYIALQARKGGYHGMSPVPMSALILAKSPKDQFTFKTSLIQDTIENTSETWVYSPRNRQGLKRSIDVEDTPFICTPKFGGSRKSISDIDTHSTPKRVKLDVACNTPITPRSLTRNLDVSERLRGEISSLLEMPDVQTPPHWKLLEARRGRETTPQSILKVRKSTTLDCESAPSPVDSRYFGESDDDLETGSRHSHLSESRQLRFTIPTESESGSTPSPTPMPLRETDIHLATRESETKDDTPKHHMSESSIFESPPKKFALEPETKEKKSLKDTVRGRRSLALSLNSSLSDDQNASTESIADIAVTLLNLRYEKTRASIDKSNVTSDNSNVTSEKSNVSLRSTERSKILVTPEKNDEVSTVEKPSGRKPIRDKTPVGEISTTERQDSPTIKHAAIRRLRSRSRTPEVRSSPILEPISELPKQESELETVERKSVHVPQRTFRLRSRSRTPDRLDKTLKDSPRLESICESPNKQEPTLELSSPTRSLRSRSRTPDVDKTEHEQEPEPASPRTLRGKSKTPDREVVMSPKPDRSVKPKKTLSRMVLEANTFSKAKPDIEENTMNKQEQETMESTPKKNPTALKLDFSPIDNKSILNTPQESPVEISPITEQNYKMKSFHLPNISDLFSKTLYEKSVLHSYESSIEESVSRVETCVVSNQDESNIVSNRDMSQMESCSAFRDMSSVLTSDSDVDMEELKSVESREVSMAKQALLEDDDKSNDQRVKRHIIEIEQEIHDIEGSISDDDDDSGEQNSNDDNGSGEQNSNDDNDSGEQNSEDDNERQSDEQTDDDDDEESNDEAGNDVISIADSSEEQEQDSSSSSECNLQIDLDARSQGPTENIQTDTEQNTENIHSDTKQNIEDIHSPSYTSSSNSEFNLQIDLDPTSQRPTENLQTNTEQNIENIQIETRQNIENIQIDSRQNENIQIDTEKAIDPLNQGNISLMTDDDSVLISDRSNLDFSQYQDQSGGKGGEEQSPCVVQGMLTVILPPTSPENPTEELPSNETLDVVDAASKTSSKTDKITTAVTKNGKLSQDDNKQSEEKSDNQKTKEKNKNKAPETPQKTTKQKQKSIEEFTEKIDSDVICKDSDSNVSRKRSQSSSVKPDEADVSVSKTRSTRTRSTTPTAEVRRILTRRASKELSESQCLDESVKEETLGARRRTTRSRSKSIDDSNVTLDEEQNKSISESTAEPKRALPIRGKRKSILSSRPELTAIPEVMSEDGDIDNQTLINELAGTHRLTRHQKSTLDSWLGVSNEPRKDTPIRQSKESPEISDHSSVSSESMTFDVSFQRTKRSRMTRAASESKTMTKAAKVSRRISVDVVNPSEQYVSPYRTRRASFNKACEALTTPTSRRLSTELKRGESESGPSSPLSEVDPSSTPSRRTRRTSSTQSTSSRSKK